MLEYVLTEEELRPRPDPVRSTLECQPGNLWEAVRQSGAAWKDEGAGAVVQNWIEEGAQAGWSDGPVPPFQRVTRPMSVDEQNSAGSPHRGVPLKSVRFRCLELMAVEQAN